MTGAEEGFAIIDKEPSGLSSLESLPDELLFQCTSDLDADSLQSLRETSQRLRRFAQDEGLWKSVCTTLLSPYTFRGSVEGLDHKIWGAPSFYDLWRHLLREWTPRLGLWIHTDERKSFPVPAGEVLSILADGEKGFIFCAPLEIIDPSIFEVHDTLDQTQEQFLHDVTIRVEARFIEVIPHDWDPRSTVRVEHHQPRVRPYAARGFQVSYGENTARAGIPPVEVGDRIEAWPDLAKRLELSIKGPDDMPPTPYPSPPLLPLLRSAECQSLRSLITPQLSLLLHRGIHPRNYVPIVNPDHDFSSSSDVFFKAGIYTATYATHGSEFLWIGMRTLTERDFDAGSSWFWEGHFGEGSVADGDHGPFSSQNGRFNIVREMFPAEVAASPGHLRPGVRVIEAVKITGDANVPRGQRSFVAFVDDPLVPRAALERPLAPKTARPLRPWPLRARDDPHLPSVLPPQELYSEREPGVTLPGRGRVALSHFSFPSWISCVVHIESEEELNVWWSLGNDIMTFKRIHTVG